MGKQVRVALFGEQRRNIVVEDGATDGAVIGLNLVWPDGTLVTEGQIRNTTTTTTTTDGTGVWTGTTIWSLITGIPAIIKSLAALATNGWIRNDSNVISALHWPYVKPGVDAGESFTLPTGEQLLVYESFDMTGSVTLDGQLVILGPDRDTGIIRDYIPPDFSILVPEDHQYIVQEEFKVDGTFVADGDLVVIGPDNDSKGLVRDYLPVGWTITVPAEHQYIVHENFAIDGTFNVEGDGELVVLGENEDVFLPRLVLESDPTTGGIAIGDESADSFGWRDITAPIELRGTGANDPTFTRSLGGGPFAAYKFALNDEAWFYFHIPHDIVIPAGGGGATVYIHVHWKSDGTDVTNTVKWEWTYSHAKGFGQEAMNMTGTTVSAEQVSAGQWYPMVTESAGLTISNITEPDGILEVYMRRITNGATDVTDGIYVTTCDVHYQSHNLATKNKAPDFYT